MDIASQYKLDAYGQYDSVIDLREGFTDKINLPCVLSMFNSKVLLSYKYGIYFVQLCKKLSTPKEWLQ